MKAQKSIIALSLLRSLVKEKLSVKKKEEKYRFRVFASHPDINCQICTIQNVSKEGARSAMHIVEYETLNCQSSL